MFLSVCYDIMIFFDWSFSKHKLLKLFFVDSVVVILSSSFGIHLTTSFWSFINMQFSTSTSSSFYVNSYHVSI